MICLGGSSLLYEASRSIQTGALWKKSSFSAHAIFPESVDFMEFADTVKISQLHTLTVILTSQGALAYVRATALNTLIAALYNDLYSATYR